MIDFFDSVNAVENTPLQVSSVFESIYGWAPETRAFLGINLCWPKFSLPENYQRYFLSWHTEQFDVFWLKREAERVYPKPILVASDCVVDTDIFPDNVKFVRWITWHKQLDQLVEKFGLCQDPKLPTYKISSLAFRISQYKNYVTAYLLQHADLDQIILTYHKELGKPEDLHGYPKDIPWLDALDISGLEPKYINFRDDFGWSKNTPVANGNWRSAPFEDALVNFTNESFHYSKSELAGKFFLYPSPYITEKTWKPLLAGRPFLSVAQWHVYKELGNLGLKFNFGWPIEFDNDPGDLTRIRDIFTTIDIILKTPLADLYEQSLDSVLHNIDQIKNGEFAGRCCEQNEQVKGSITNFLSV